MKNMKKYISALLAITVLLTFAGCNKSTHKEEFENNETQQTETEPQQTSTETTVTDEPEHKTDSRYLRCKAVYGS